MNNDSVWPGWETVEMIGRGGFGTVYKIRKDVLGDTQEAALKVISIPQNDSEITDLYSEDFDEQSITSIFQEHLKNIVAEYTLMRKMSGSANIVNCDDVQYFPHKDGFGWDILIKMELLTPLAKALPAQISEDMVLKVAKDICNALELCQKYQIVHRDIKPHNIFVSPNGDYKLGDFGVAKSMSNTMGATKVGTSKFMAPEVYNNQPYGKTADIYSLGLVLYWLLNERRVPFAPLPPEKPSVSQDSTATFRRLSGEPLPPPIHGSEMLQEIVLKACAYDPKARYQSAADMLADLNKTEEKYRKNVTGKYQGNNNNNASKQKKDPSSGDTSCTKQETKIVPAPPRNPVKPLQITLLCIGILLVLSLLLLLTRHKHSWIPATCTSPQLCTSCGETAGNPLGHDWLDATCTTKKMCSMCGISGGNKLDHIWLDATCTTEKTCSLCGITSGSKLDHDWLDATCTTEKTCSLCGITSGSKLDHIWKDATQDAPRTCTLCGLTDGRSLGYSLTDCTVLSSSNGAYATKDVESGNWTDTFGNSYPKSLRFWVANLPNWSNSEYIELSLNGSYSTLDLTMAAEESSANGTRSKIRVYASNTLLYESNWIDNMTPIEASLDVKGYNKLKIECITDSPDFCYCIVAGSLFRD